MATVSRSKLEAVERLGVLKARIAKLTEEHDALELKLRSKLGTITSEHYKLSVFDVAGKKFNWTKAKRVLGEAAYTKLWIPNVFRSSKLTYIEVEED